MQFWHRLALAQLLTVASVLLVVVASHFRVRGLHEAFVESSEEYQELRMLADANTALTDARLQMQRQSGADEGAREQLATAMELLASYLALQDTHTINAAHQQRERSLARQGLIRIEGVLHQPRSGEASYEDQLRLIDLALSDLQGLLSLMDAVVVNAGEEAERQLARSKQWEVLAPVVALSLTSLAGLWQYLGVIRPVRRLRAGASRMARGDFSARVDESGRDEVGALSADFNKMASELESLYRDLDDQIRVKSRELAHAERLTSIGFLAAGIAHEINNPLSIIHGYAQEARQHHGAAGAADGELAPVLDVILEESGRCRDIVRRLLTLASPGDSSRTAVEMKEAVAAVVETVKDLPRYRRSRIETRFGPAPTWVHANRDEIKQVLLNLLINGLEATGPGGTVSIRCSREGDQIVTEFQDDGCGISADMLVRVFDPFYSTRKFDGHRGVGLGLSVSHAIARQHGGQLTAESDGPGQGSRFTITMPAEARLPG